MARLSEIIKYQRSQGKGVGSSLAGGIKERLKEKFDPRKMFNQNGLMVSLFPGLKSYKAKTTKEKSISKNVTGDFLTVRPLFDSIDAGSTLSAKNSMVLPSMHRDFNVIRQNLVKLVKLENVKPATKADMYFVKASEREKLYESEMQTKKGAKSSSPTKIQSLKDSKSGSGFSVGLKVFGILAAGALIVKAIEKIEKEDIEKAMTDFIAFLTGSSSAEAAINRNPGNISKDSSGKLYKEIQISEAEKELNKFKFKDLSEAQKTAFFESQFKSEGNKPGTIAYDQNNPGAMVYKEWMKKYGGEPGKTVVGPDGITRTFAKFPTLEKGKEAQRALWETGSYSEKPLGQALRTWVTPMGDDANTAFAGYVERGRTAITKAGPMPAQTVSEPPTTARDYSVSQQNSGQDFFGKKASVGLKLSDTATITSPFGKRVFGEEEEFHGGVDIGMPVGSPVYSISEGEVVNTLLDPSSKTREGTMVSVKNANGEVTYYMHLSEINSDIKKGQKIKKGQILGKSGKTGLRVSGPHLHLQIKSGAQVREPTLEEVKSSVIKGIDGQTLEATQKDDKKVSFSTIESKVSGESINLASAKVMLEEELGLTNSVFILSQNITHTNTVYLPRAAGNINPVKQLLTSSLG